MNRTFLIAATLMSFGTTVQAADIVNSSDITLQGGAGTSNSNSRTGVPNDVSNVTNDDVKIGAQPRIKAGTHLHKDASHSMKKVDGNVDTQTTIGNDYVDEGHK